jgi:hypothetical protein
MPRRARMAGSMLLDAVLATLVISSLAALAYEWKSENDRLQTGRQVADAKATFIALAGQYFQDNRASFEAAMKDGTGASSWCLVGVNADGSGGTPTVDTTLHTCTIDTYFLRAKKLWPAGMNLDEADGRYAAVFKMEYDTQSTPQPTGGDFMFTPLIQPTGTLSPVAIDSDAYKEARSAMRALGGTGGLVPVGDVIGCANVRATTTYQACGSGWKINLSDYISAPQLAVFANALPN